MWEFLQSYGTWIVLGVAFVVMMKAHGHAGHGGHGGGCGMGTHGRARRPEKAMAEAEAEETEVGGRAGSCH